MNHDKLIDTLGRTYKLRPNQIAVLRVLITGQRYGYLELSKAANVPKTKVYEIANELQQLGLVDFSQEGKARTMYHMADPRKKILEFLNRQMDVSLQRYDEMLEIIEKDEAVEERDILQSPNQYVFGALRVISESHEIFVLSRRKSAPAIFYPKDREMYYQLRNGISRSRETLTGTKELTRIMWEETLKAVNDGKQFKYIMTYQGLAFFLERYKEVFGEEAAREFIKGLPVYLRQHNHSVYVIEESNPLAMYLSTRRMVLVVSEVRGEIAGIHTNNKQIVDNYVQLFREMISRSKPIEDCLERLII